MEDGQLNAIDSIASAALPSESDKFTMEFKFKHVMDQSCLTVYAEGLAKKNRT